MNKVTVSKLAGWANGLTLVSVFGYLSWQFVHMLSIMWPQHRDTDDLGLMLYAPFDILQIFLVLFVGFFGFVTIVILAIGSARMVVWMIFWTARKKQK